jgi:hypothetical protein
MMTQTPIDTAAIRARCEAAKYIWLNNPGTGKPGEIVTVSQALCDISALLDALKAETARANIYQKQYMDEVEIANRFRDDCDRWKARAEALEGVCAEECVCSICLHGSGDVGIEPYLSCFTDKSAWKFDERRNSYHEGGGTE